jgi:hypothetical protein
LRFAKSVGIPLNEESKYNALYGTKKFSINELVDEEDFSKINKQLSKITLNNDSEAENNENAQNKNANSNQNQIILTRYRLAIFLNYLKDVPLDLDTNKTYYLEYHIFEQKVKIKLDSSNLIKKGNFNYIPINKIRLFYIFSHSKKEVNYFLNEQKFLTINLLMETKKNGNNDLKKLGTIDLDLTEFVSDKIIKREFSKYFSGKDIFPILSWGLNVFFI